MFSGDSVMWWGLGVYPREKRGLWLRLDASGGRASESVEGVKK